MTSFARWTQTAITSLRGLAQSGQTAAEIAQTLGRSSEDVSGMAIRLRIPLTRSS